MMAFRSRVSSSLSLRLPYRNFLLLLHLIFLILNSLLFQVSSLVLQQGACNSGSPALKSQSFLPSLATSRTDTTMMMAAGQAAATTATTTSDDDNMEHHVYPPPRHVKVLGICGGIGSGKSAACKMLVSEFGCIAHLEADIIAHSVYEPGSMAIQDIVQAFGPDVLHVVENKGDDENDNNNFNNATIDRAKLGSLVFANRSKMQQLERIVWPHVKDKIQQRIQEIDERYGKKLEKEEEEEEEAAAEYISAENADEKEKKHGRRAIVIVEAAVLLDAGWDDLMNPNVGNGGAGVWVVRASNHVARQRLIEQRGYTEQVADKRIQAQQEESRRGIGAENLQMELDRGTVTQVITNDGGLDDLRTALAQALSSIPTSSS